jgi:putative transposase
MDTAGQWQANLRILEVAEIKTVPYLPLSHPFVERLIGTIRREYLDRTLFWTTVDLESKLCWSSRITSTLIVPISH